MTLQNEKCGDCKLFKTDDCPERYHFSEYVDGRPLMDADCAACGSFQFNPKAKAKKKILKDSGVTVNGCFEAIYHNGMPCFLTENGGTFNITENLTVNDEEFAPKDARHIPYEPYGWFEGSVPNREDLFWNVWRVIDSFIDVEPIWKDVLAAMVLLSYHQEKLQTVPYLLLYGDNESGKSTVLGILKFLCYRPMYGVTVPPADIYGFLEDSDSIGCILEDEIQGIHKDTDKIKIYKAGYKQGAIVPRTLMTQHDRIIKYYRTFCFKACASEQIPQVKGFNERFLFIPMVEGYPEKEWADVTKEDLKRLYELRNCLLKWRMLSRSWELPNVELSIKGRLKELWKPLLQITSGLTMYDGLFKFVENQRKERLSLKQDTLEGKIVKVIVEIFNEAKTDVCAIPFSTIWTLLREELDGKIDEKKPHVMDTSEFFQVTKNKVGYRLREVLSGKTKVLREKVGDEWVSTKAYEFNMEKLRRVAKKYGFEILVTKLPTLPSSEGMPASETMESMEKTDGNNVEKEPHTPQELGNLSNSVTNETQPSISSKNHKEENTGGEKDSNLVTTGAEELIHLEGDWQDRCVHCGVNGKMRYQLNQPDGSWGLLCEKCGLKLEKPIEKEARLTGTVIFDGVVNRE
jgi:hypothetical protein